MGNKLSTLKDPKVMVKGPCPNDIEVVVDVDEEKLALQRKVEDLTKDLTILELKLKIKQLESKIQVGTTTIKGEHEEAQVGPVNFESGEHEEAQVGPVNFESGEHEEAQVGPVNFESGENEEAQVGPGNFESGEHEESQVGPVNFESDEHEEAQVGPVNSESGESDEFVDPESIYFELDTIDQAEPPSIISQNQIQTDDVHDHGGNAGSANSRQSDELSDDDTLEFPLSQWPVTDYVHDSNEGNASSNEEDEEQGPMDLESCQLFEFFDAVCDPSELGSIEETLPPFTSQSETNDGAGSSEEQQQQQRRVDLELGRSDVVPDVDTPIEIILNAEPPPLSQWTTDADDLHGLGKRNDTSSDQVFGFGYNDMESNVPSTSGAGSESRKSSRKLPCYMPMELCIDIENEEDEGDSGSGAINDEFEQNLLNEPKPGPSRDCYMHLSSQSSAEKVRKPKFLIIHGKVQSKSKAQDSKPYRCSNCDKIFNYKRHLKRHAILHTGIKPFKCTVCSKAFARKDAVIAHMKIHKGDKDKASGSNTSSDEKAIAKKPQRKARSNSKPCKCSYCDTSFTNEHYLKRHSRAHTGDRPYTCTVCSKTFTRSDTLAQHIKIHVVEKPYECSVCLKKFRCKRYLSDHMQIHETENRKQFKCTRCSFVFQHRSNFYRHFSKKHRQEQTQPSETMHEEEEEHGQDLLEMDQSNEVAHLILIADSTEIPNTNANIATPSQIQSGTDTESPPVEIVSDAEETIEPVFINNANIATSSQIPSGTDTETPQNEIVSNSQATTELLDDDVDEDFDNNNSNSSDTVIANEEEILPVVIHTENESGFRSEDEESTVSTIMTSLTLAEEYGRGKSGSEDEESTVSTVMTITTLNNEYGRGKRRKQRPNYKDMHMGPSIENSSDEYEYRSELDDSDSDQSNARKVKRPKFTISISPRKVQSKNLKLHSCSHCGKSFTKNSRLQRHLQTHDEERRLFKCTECSQSYAHHYDLTLHKKKTHTLELPHQCPECKKKFATKRDLNKHLKIHVESEPFLCTQCGSLFKYSKSLLRHTSKKHPENQEQQ